VPYALSWSRRWRSDRSARAVSAIAAVTVAAALPGAARAADTPPEPGASAVIQYAELVPTATGPKAPGIQKERRAPLPPRAKRALDEASVATAEALTAVATSSDYGAPAARPPSAMSKGAPRDARPPALESSLARTFQATAVAAAPFDDARIIGLLVAMLAALVGAGALAVSRRRF